MLKRKSGSCRCVSSLCTVARWLLFAVCMSVLCVVAGAVAMLVFNSAYWLINLIWIWGWEASCAWFYPVIVCSVCGLALMGFSFLSRRRAEQSAEESEASNQRFSTYETSALLGADGLLMRIVHFLLPFAGGAPVGVLKGFVGLVVGGATWVRTVLAKVGGALGLGSEGGETPRWQKYLLRGAAIALACVGVAITVELAGVAMSLPFFEVAELSRDTIAVVIVLSVAGWAIGLLYLAMARLARMLDEKLVVLRPVLPLLCGVVLGVVMVFLPHVGLPGSDAFSFQLLGQWEGLAPAVLLATALIRTLLVAFCLNLGWPGGPFMPLLYCAICLGYGVAGLFGLDAMVCITAASCSVLVAFTGKPLAGLMVFLCCPVQSFPVVLVALIVAALLPHPRGLEGELARRG